MQSKTGTKLRNLQMFFLERNKTKVKKFQTFASVLIEQADKECGYFCHIGIILVRITFDVLYIHSNIWHDQLLKQS